MNDRSKSPGAAERPASVVEARKITKRYGRTWALRGVDMTVRRGELVGLLGPNGSGKSTLLRIISTASRPTRGKLLVFGENSQARASIVARLGVLAPRTYLYDELTALENLRFAAVMYGLTSEEAPLFEALETVGLAHVADREVRTFSSGMRKRVSLARATLHDPDLLLLDEPFAALDVEGAEWVHRFVEGLRDSNKTAIIATHAHSRARQLCDRAVELVEGRVSYDGPAASYDAAR